MLRSYLSVALRTLRKQPTFTFINIFGLALGMAACLLILRYVQDERAYDQHHADAERIYRVVTDRTFPDRTEAFATTPRSLAEALVTDVPDLEAVTRLSSENAERVMVQYGTQRFFEEGVRFADVNIFEVFNISLAQGDPAQALASPQTVVISEAVAARYFGDANPIGEQLRFRLSGDGDVFDYEVTGILASPAGPSHARFDVLASYLGHPFATRDGAFRTNWLGLDVHTYVKLRPASDPVEVTATLATLVQTYIGPALENAFNASLQAFQRSGNGITFSLQPITSIHLHSQRRGELGPNGNQAHVYFFSAIAAFILLIACVNFMNLSTARSEGRAKEVGVRKALGSNRRQLIIQFLLESLLMSTLALILAVGLMEVLLPVFNTVAQKSMTFSYFSDGFLVLLLAGFAVAVGLLAGSYPAFFLSTFDPVGVLKGKVGIAGRASQLRNGLVVFQFAVSIALIVGTIVVYQQMDYMLAQRIQFEDEQVVVVEGTQVLRAQAEAFRTAALTIPGITEAAFGENVPGRAFETSRFRTEGMTEDEAVTVARMYAGFGFAETMGFQLVDGRTPALAHAASDSTAAILNETAVQVLGLTDPIGQTITRLNNGLTYTIVGVIEDFHFESLHRSIGPIAIFGPDPFYNNRPRELFTARIRTDALAPALTALQDQWAAFMPSEPFTYTFLEAEHETLYRAEERVGYLSAAFAGLAILIACLGLFGLAAYTAEQRTKEIGIRKVLGASVVSVIVLLSQDFLRLVGVAFILAAPLVYFALTRWLEGFAYHIDLSLAVFIGAGIGALLVALLTVSYQALRAAASDPIEALRYE